MRGIRRLASSSSSAVNATSKHIRVNGRDYKLPQAGYKPLVGICLDGSAQEYFDVASRAGVTPNIDACRTKGLVRAAMPTFTNPNNMSIVTGVPPSKTGICGNYFYDRVAKTETMMNDVKFLRCGTIFENLEREGAHVIVVTAKNKLLKLLTAGLSGTSSVGFSAEQFDSEEATRAVRNANVGVDSVEDLVGSPAPGIYDPDISIYCMEAGLRLIERLKDRSDKPIVAYLSTTDFVQHKFAPDEPEALDFYSKVDSVFGSLVDAGCDVALTADHGMENKYSPTDGKPNVAYLETLLLDQKIDSRVILPITDPYVAHHGALGGYATVYLDDLSEVDEAVRVLEDAIDDRVGFTVHRADDACKEFDLPRDRIGDLVVVADKATVLGRTTDFHDLGQIPRLRSHGAISEQIVPFLSNVGLESDDSEALRGGSLRNFDLFSVLLNSGGGARRA
eukprot:g2631.t1